VDLTLDVVDDPPVDLSVVLPAYQEAQVIGAALARLHEHLSAVVDSFELVVVCDGCTDGTPEAARSTGLTGVRVAEYRVNRGKGHALVTGVALARGRDIAFFDADLDLHPRALLAMLERRRGGAQVVVGSKIHPSSTVRYPAARRVQSRVYRRLIRWWFDLDVSDTQTGAKLFDRIVLEACLPGLTSTGFAFDLELLVRAHDLGFSIEESPVDLDYQFDSRVPLHAAVQVLRDTRMIARRRRRGQTAPAVQVLLPATPEEGATPLPLPPPRIQADACDDAV
jgi:glycosyltransferase involved in cell wall biosynthesis